MLQGFAETKAIEPLLMYTLTKHVHAKFKRKTLPFIGYIRTPDFSILIHVHYSCFIRQNERSFTLKFQQRIGKFYIVLSSLWRMFEISDKLQMKLVIQAI